MNRTKTKTRRGIGYEGRIFQYGTAVGPDGCTLRRRDGMNATAVQIFNKDPAVKRAAKKRQRRDDMNFQD